MRCDFTKMKQRVDQLDEIISPLISIPSGNDSISLRFAYAYAKRAANLFKDSLLVLTSTNFGKNWNDTLFAEGGAALATIAKEVGSTRFVPTDSSQWKTLQLDLTKYKGTDLLVSFKTVNDNGSNLYLDNIQFFKGLHPASIESKKNETNQLLLFPNPSSDYINIKINEGSFKGRYALVNSLGQIQDQGLLEMDGHTKRIPVSMLPAGVYYVLIQNNQEVFTKAFVKK